MVVQTVNVVYGLRNRLSLLFAGSAFLAALIPMHMPYQVFGLDMTGTTGAVVARIPWAVCVLAALLLHKGGTIRPWWVMLSAPLAFPNVLALAIASVAWSIGGFAP